MSLQPNYLYRFGPYRLDPVEGLLMEGERKVPLTPKALQTLLILLQNQGRLVEKEELLQKVWPDTFVEESTLAQNVSTLRKQLKDDRSDATYIETVPKRGYRFVAPVEVVEASSQPAAAVTKKLASELLVSPKRSWRFVWISLGLVAVVSLAGVLTWRYRSKQAAKRPLLIVLPVENLTGDPNQEFLSDGLTEELIAQLGSLDADKLGIIARTSSMTYKGSGKTVPQIGKELGVDYLLEGSIREAGEKVRVTAQLIRVRDQTHLWAQSYDREAKDLLKLQTEIAESVASSIELQLTNATRTRLAKASPVDPQAYQTYLQGRYYWNTRSQEGLLKSVDYYNRSLQLDPLNARAYAGLADAYNLLSYYGYVKGKENVDRATAAARKALELDDNLAEAHASLAYSNFYWWWKWPEAERDFRRAIELDDNYLPAHQWYALFLTANGRPLEGLREIERAKELDPLSPAVRAGSAFVNYFARRYDDAIAECNTALATNPKLMSALYVRGLSYEAKGDTDKAIVDFQGAIDLSNVGAWIYVGALGHAYGISGRRSDAQAVLARMEKSSGQDFVGSFNVAVIWAGLGDRQKTVAFLQSAWKEEDAAMTWLRVDPRFDSVRSDPWVQSWPGQLSAKREK